jgi:hypothetical protein
MPDGFELTMRLAACPMVDENAAIRFQDQLVTLDLQMGGKSV